MVAILRRCHGTQRQMKRKRATERDVISAPWYYTADRHNTDIIGKPRKLAPPMYRSKCGMTKKGKTTQDAFYTVTARRSKLREGCMTERSKIPPVYLGLFIYFILYLTKVSVTQVHIALNDTFVSE